MSNIDCVFDANVVMAMLISGKSWWLSFIADKRIYTPDYVVDELTRYESVIRTSTKFGEDELARFTVSLFERITVVPGLGVVEESRVSAYILCKDVDIKDISYVALSIQLGFPLVTRDKPLFTGLRKKGFRNVLLFDDFMQRF